MKKHLKSIISLTVICIVVAAALALTNYVTAPIIEKNAAAAADEATVDKLLQGNWIIYDDKGYEKMEE